MPSLGLGIGLNSVGVVGSAVPPTLDSATVNAAGDTLTLVFSDAVDFGAGGNGGWTMTPRFATVLGATGLSYSSGSGTDTLVYSITGRALHSSAYETATISYVQPGNGVEAGGVDLASLGPVSVTNNSTFVSGASFVHDFDTRDAQVFGGDGTGDTAGGAGSSISNTFALDGTTSLACTGTGFPLNEFNTSPSVNPDFNWAAGRMEIWAYMATGPSWPSSNAQLASVKNEAGTTSIRVIVFRGGTEGSIRIYMGNTSTNPITLTGFTRDAWHRIIITWDEAGPGGIYGTGQLDSNAAVNRTVAITAADADPAQILEGNDTATAATFYLGGLLRVWNNTSGT